MCHLLESVNTTFNVKAIMNNGFGLWNVKFSLQSITIDLHLIILATLNDLIKSRFIDFIISFNETQTMTRGAV